MILVTYTFFKNNFTARLLQVSCTDGCYILADWSLTAVNSWRDSISIWRANLRERRGKPFRVVKANTIKIINLKPGPLDVNPVAWVSGVSGGKEERCLGRPDTQANPLRKAWYSGYMPGHPLYPSVLKTKESSARLRVPSSQLFKVNTQRFKNSFLIGYFSNIE